VCSPNDLTDRSVVDGLLRRAGIRPSKRFGQNFLVDRHALSTIADTVRSASPEAILEIGAGLGTLTRELAAIAPRVIAVEIDRRLAGILEDTLTGLATVEIVRADILDVDLEAVSGGRSLYVAGNLPYRITSPILTRLVASRAAVSEALVLTQSEVAEKVAASPGPNGTALGVLIQAYGSVETVARIPRGAFHPLPEVGSTLWRIRFRPQPRFTAPEDRFFTVVRALYGKRRKMARVALRDLVSAERAVRMLEAAGIDPTARGETLSFGELDRIAAALETGESR